MHERTNEQKEYRTMPLNTTGQSLLSGNVFCGHCGGRLALTTNGKVYRQADGTCMKKKRIRYVCYNKTRHRAECGGQTGYTMHILDDIITDILHQVFDKMKSTTSDIIIWSAHQKQMTLLQGDWKRAKAENTKANGEYESLKAEVLKAVQGKSALPVDVLNELLDETRQRVLDSSRRVSELITELESKNNKIAEMQAEFDRIATWSESFDSSDMETRKMICEETLTYCDFPSEHWTRIRTNNVMERLNREIRRRTRVVGCFPDGNSALMLVCARLRHVAGTQWGNKKYMNMKLLGSPYRILSKNNAECPTRILKSYKDTPHGTSVHNDTPGSPHKSRLSASDNHISLIKYSHVGALLW